MEMYLKAGITKLFVGCSEDFFDHAVRKRYGHKLRQLAKDLHFDASQQDLNDLKDLEAMMVTGARYPVVPGPDGSSAEQESERTRTMWNGTSYFRFRQLALRVRRHVSHIDADPQRPMSHWRVPFGGDGYVVCRSGGGLPPRVTYRRGSDRMDDGDDVLQEVKLLVVARHDFTGMWDVAVKNEDRTGLPKLSKHC
ncbi:hypothetical protein [Pseudorhodoferax sp. Leaf265]|uniref:hypothetical protein n=1 Tax=Pseudorhodoferax sp. Leaf265 TaxID=1736315 RepID=UPI0012E90630|nr:hypothetical protein [Pseudorhodoferax sp. Leaf265]